MAEELLVHAVAEDEMDSPSLYEAVVQTKVAGCRSADISKRADLGWGKERWVSASQLLSTGGRDVKCAGVVARSTW